MTAETNLPFSGSKQLVAMLDDAVAQGSAEETVMAVKEGLCRLIQERTLQLPPNLKQAERDSYARRLLYRSPRFSYEVIAMIWGPGQGTPLHDHAGIWCVDGVLEGQVTVTQYDLLERDGDLFRFQPQKVVEAGFGAAGSLIPPFEYHTIENRQPQASITIHVYGGRMDCCTIFERQSSGWYLRRQKSLQYTPAGAS